MSEADDRERHRDEYRTVLKSVFKETLNENNAQVRLIFKEAIKEWLSEQMQDGHAWIVRIAAALLLVAFVWIVLNPKQ